MTGNDRNHGASPDFQGLRLFDTHCHLAGDELWPHAPELFDRAVQNGVGGLAVIAADEFSLRAMPKLVQDLRLRSPQTHVVGTAGLHPHEAKDITDELWRLVIAFAQDAAGIGETGLDYHYNLSDRATQREFFKRHIDLACQLKKPLVIHCREAREEILEFLDTAEIKRHPNPGILHCFTEDWATARRLLDLNFYISFSGILSFRNAEALREVARQVPLERLLIETDSPWLAPIPHRGKRNEPAFVRGTFEALRAVRAESPEDLAAALWQNSCRVFGTGAAC